MIQNQLRNLELVVVQIYMVQIIELLVDKLSPSQNGILKNESGWQNKNKIHFLVESTKNSN